MTPPLFYLFLGPKQDKTAIARKPGGVAIRVLGSPWQCASGAIRTDYRPDSLYRITGRLSPNPGLFHGCWLTP